MVLGEFKINKSRQINNIVFKKSILINKVYDEYF